MTLPRLTFAPIDTWPWPHTSPRSRAPFRTGLDTTMRELRHELARLGADTAQLCIAVHHGQIVADGSRPYAGARPEHPGVIVVADTRHGPARWGTDRYRHWTDNVRAIRLGLESLRAVDRYGITRSGEQYRGFAALPPGDADDTPTHLTRDQALDVIRRHADAPTASDAEVVRHLDRLFRRAAKTAHPDAPDGSTDAFLRLRQAHDLLKREPVAW